MQVSNPQWCLDGTTACKERLWECKFTYKTHQALLKQENTELVSFPQYPTYCCWDFVLLNRNKLTKKRQAIKAMERSLCFLKECGESNEGLASLRRKTLSSWWFWINGSSHYTAQGRGTKPRCALENTLIKWKLLPLFHPRKALLIITQHQHGLVMSSNIFFLPTIFCSSFILLQRNWRNLTWFRVKIMYVRTPFVRLGGNTGLQLTSCSTILPGEAALLPSLPVSSPFLLLLKKK